MSRLALGTVQFGLSYGVANKTGKVEFATAKKMLEMAQCHNINLLDTAINYGGSEQCLGEIGVKNFKIVTKLPKIPEEASDIFFWVRSQIMESCHRLGVSSIYGLLLHTPAQLLDSRGKIIYSALQLLKESGLVSKIGISVYSPVELDLLLEKFSFDLVQAPFSIIDQRLQSSGMLDRLKKMNIEVHVRSIFLQGLLLMPQNIIPHKFAQWSAIWEQWNYWLACHNISALDACLAFVFSVKEIDHVIVGADSEEHLKQIIHASLKSFSLAEFPKISSLDENLINPSQWKEL